LVIHVDLSIVLPSHTNQSTMNGVHRQPQLRLTLQDGITQVHLADKLPLAPKTKMITMQLGRAGRMVLSLRKLIFREQIIYDSLKTEHPLWPFSSFGAPFFRPLIQGDLSFDEYHLAAIEANRNGTFDQWVRHFGKCADNSNGSATNE